MPFSVPQTKQLLAPIRPTRIVKSAHTQSHVSQQDATAHLIRVFGFGNHLVEVLDTTLLHESCRNPDAAYPQQKWDVVYSAKVRVTILQDHGTDHLGMLKVQDRIIALWEDVSCGDAQNQVKHDAHDLALKSAVSTAKKRCLINLGDQWGLSLYNKGQETALVGGTHILPEGWDKPTEQSDLQDGVKQQVTLGTDETIYDEKQREEVEPTEEQKRILAASLGAVEISTEKEATT